MDHFKKIISTFRTIRTYFDHAMKAVFTKECMRQRTRNTIFLDSHRWTAVVLSTVWLPELYYDRQQVTVVLEVSGNQTCD